jgi:hypothetical protein
MILNLGIIIPVWIVGMKIRRIILKGARIMKWIWNNIVMDKFSRLVSKLDGWLWRKRWDNYTKRKNKWKT